MNSVRLLLIFLVLLFISGAVFYVVSFPRSLRIEQTAAGVLDMTGKDFTQNFFALDGQWEFYFGQLLTPDDFANGRVDGKSFVTVPQSWHKDGYPLYGFATYRLILLTDEEELSMFIPEIADASIAWINGAKVSEAGRAGTSNAENISGVRNAFVHLLPDNGQVEIIIQAANYGWLDSGIWASIEVGRHDILMRDKLVRRAVLFCFIGFLLAMFMYHSMLFAQRPKEKLYLVFALTCLMVALRFVFAQNGPAALFIPSGASVAVRYITSTFLSLQMVGIVAFTHLVFKIPVGRVRIAIYAAAYVITYFIILIFPDGTISAYWLYTGMLPSVIVYFSALKRHGIKENPYNLLHLTVLTIFTFWYPLHHLLLDNVMYVPAIFTNLFLMLTQCVVLAVSYAESKRREEALTEQNELLDGLSRMKTEYLANMSHEIKTPLTVISVHVQRAAELFEKSGTDNKTISVSLRRAQDEIMRVARLSENALWLSSMQESREHMKPLNTSELLTKTTEAYRAVIEKRGNVLNINVADGLPSVYGNADQLIQVIANLLTNANTHTQNGKITVSAQLKAEELTVTVTDNGTGISSELLPRIFERGVTGSDGAGVGLEICKNIIEAHCGTICMQSETKKGASVAFTLPILSAETGETNNA